MNFKTLNRLRDLHDQIIEKDTEIIKLERVLENLVEQDGMSLKLTVSGSAVPKEVSNTKFLPGGYTGILKEPIVLDVDPSKISPEQSRQINNIADEFLAQAERVIAKKGVISQKELMEIGGYKFNLSHKSAIIFMELHLKEVKQERAVLKRYADECVRTLHASIKTID